MKIAWVIVLVCVVAAPVAADLIYLTNGKVYKGQATRKGDRVIVKMKYATIELAAGDVRIIVKTEPTTRPDTPQPMPPAVILPDRAFRVGNATRPEPVALGLMRVLATTRPGERSFRLRKQVERWRNASHDRLRKIGSQWYGPKEFEKRRTTFAIRLAESREASSQAARIRQKDQAGKNKYKRLMKSATDKAALAAKAWPDLLLRRFLMGITDYQGGNFHSAEPLFRRCVREAPLVAAFHQAHGMALVKVDRPLDALDALTSALRLEPGSQDALTLLTEAMLAVPATRMRTAAYTRAKAIVDQYEQPTGRTKYRPQFKWLLPGKVKQASATILPVPSYDRIDFKQAVGVAVGASALLVDTKAVGNASLVYMKVAKGKFVPARVNRGSYRSGGKATALLTIVTVADVVLTPVKLAQGDKLKPDLKIAVHALSLYTSMGTAMSPMDGVTVAPGGAGVKTPPFNVKLAAGDAASPVTDADGRLLGFLGGKTDVMAPGGGTDLFIGPGDIEPLIKRASRLRGRGYGYGAAKRTFTPEAVTGCIFVIYAIECETVK